MRSRKTWPLSNRRLSLVELSHHSTMPTGTTKTKDFMNRLFLARSFSQAKTNSIVEQDGHPSLVQLVTTLVSRRLPMTLTEWLDRRSTVMSMESILAMSSTMVMEKALPERDTALTRPVWSLLLRQTLLKKWEIFISHRDIIFCTKKIIWWIRNILIF